MYTAQAKRKENIAEYILYLWQLEDLLRALQFSPEAVYSQLVAPRGLDPGRQQELLEWYMELASLLQREGKEENGHLDHTMHLISDLQNLHNQLMELPVGDHYRMLFAGLAPELPRLREVLSDSEKLEEGMGDVELAFRALYAAMLYRIRGDEKSLRTADQVVELVSPVVAELARVYRAAEKGETDLFQTK